MQNVLSVGISKVMDVSPLVGLCTGSIPMVGGHGTSGAFGLVLEDLGLPGSNYFMYCRCYLLVLLWAHLWEDLLEEGL